jgi:hypothetical protein
VDERKLVLSFETAIPGDNRRPEWPAECAKADHFLQRNF